MITILMFISAIAFFLAIMFSSNQRSRAIWGTILGIIFVGSTLMITANFHDHWGMKKVTTTQTRQIYSPRQLPIILYQPVGTSGKDDVYLYYTSPRQTKPQHTKADEYTHNRIIRTNSTKATLTTSVTRWRYQNSFYKFLFAGSKMDGNLVARHNTFSYPKNYAKLTVKQAQAMQKQAAKQQADMTQQNN